MNASTSWSYWTHYIRDPQRAGMLSWVGNQGVLGALERALGHTVTTSTTFVVVVTVAVIGLVVAAGAYRRSSAVLGLLVVEATESLASPVSWSHHFIWMVLLVPWLALAEDRPRYGEWYGLGVAVLLWAAPYWWVPHGPSIAFAGRGWLIPVSDCFVLLFVALIGGAGFRVLRSVVEQPVESLSSGHHAVACRPLVQRSRLADEDELMRSAVEPVLGTTLDVGGVPAGDDHELLGVAGTQFVAPGFTERPHRGVGRGPQCPERSGGLGCHREGGHERAARHGARPQNLAQRGRHRQWESDQDAFTDEE